MTNKKKNKIILLILHLICTATFIAAVISNFMIMDDSTAGAFSLAAACCWLVCVILDIVDLRAIAKKTKEDKVSDNE